MKKFLSTICTVCLIASLFVCLTACDYEVDIDELLAKCDTHFEYDFGDDAFSVIVNTTDYSVYVYSTDTRMVTLDYIENDNYGISCEEDDFNGKRYEITVERTNKVVRSPKNNFVIIGLPSRLKGNILVTTVSGNVQVEAERVMTMSLKTTSGNILIKNRSEGVSITSANLKTVSGKIDAELQSYVTFVESTSGNINLNLDCGETGIKTVSGNIRCAIKGSKYDFNIKVETDRGKSNVADQAIPGVHNYLMLITTSGSINIEFDED